MENLSVIYKTIAAAIGAVVGYLFGSLTETMLILLAAIIIDYITGSMASAREGRLKSAIGFKSIPKKIAIIFMVAVGHLVDLTLNTQNVFREAVIFFYLSNELLSITENVGRLGVPIPNKIKQAIETLREKEEKLNK